jgi:RNA polymerase sigma factor (sigma-70 family)
MGTKSSPNPGGGARTDGEALARAIATYSTYLMAVAGRLKGRNLQAEEGASDLVQRTFKAALEKIRDGCDGLPGDTDEEIKAWLVGVLKNTYRDMVRHHRARKRTPVELPTPKALSPSGEAILMEEVERRKRAFQMLDPDDREILGWRDDEGLTFKAIGQRRGYSESYARRAYQRASLRRDHISHRG